MRVSTLEGMSNQLNQMYIPAQQFSGLMLEGAQRLTDFQFEMIQTYTQYSLNQWRDALEIQDTQGLQDFMEKQRRNTEAFSQKLAEDAQQLMSIGQDISGQSLRVVKSGAQRFSEATQEGPSKAESREQPEAESQAESQTHSKGPSKAEPQAQPEQKSAGNGELPIKNYDSLKPSEIEQRLEKMDANEIRPLLKYEQQHKNRKPLIDAFKRRL